MNEPNSVIAGKLQLVLLSGKGRDGFNLLDPAQIKHVAASSAVVYPSGGASPYDLINFAVPKSQCLVIDYVSLYTTLSDKSTLAVNYGLNGDYSMQWRIINGGSASAPYTPFVGSQAVVNSPCFVVYPANSTAILRLSTGVITDPDITVLLRMNGYLLDSSNFTNLAKHQTIFSNG